MLLGPSSNGVRDPSCAWAKARRLWLAATCALAAGCAGDAEEARTSLLLLTIDSLPAPPLDCSDGRAPVGSIWCVLARSGTSFTWAFTPSPESAPAAASLLTSTLPSSHGVTGSAATFLRDRVETLPALMQRHGYATAAFVADPNLGGSRHLDRGFDVYDTAGAREPTTGAGCLRAAGDARRWLDDRSPGSPPFLLWLHCASSTRGASAPPFGDGFDAPLRSVLDAASATAPTLAVAFSALRGRVSGPGPRLAAARIRIPLVWRSPGVEPGSRITTPMGLIDIAPSLAVAARVSPPEAFDGDPLPIGSQRPGTPLPSRALFAEASGERAVVLARRYYARATDGSSAHTLLLGNDGRLPREEPTSLSAEEVRPQEERIRSALGEAPLQPGEPGAAGDSTSPPAVANPSPAAVSPSPTTAVSPPTAAVSPPTAAASPLNAAASPPNAAVSPSPSIGPSGPAPRLDDTP